MITSSGCSISAFTINAITTTSRRTIQAIVTPSVIIQGNDKNWYRRRSASPPLTPSATSTSTTPFSQQFGNDERSNRRRRNKLSQLSVIVNDRDDNDTSLQPPLTPPIAFREASQFFPIEIMADSCGDIKNDDYNNTTTTTNCRIPDPYGWMRDDTRNLSSPKVLEYIQQENLYTINQIQRLMTQPTTVVKPPVLSDEFRKFMAVNGSDTISNIHQKDQYYYFTKRLPGKEYPIHCRCPLWQEKIEKDGKEDEDFQLFQDYAIILDENEIVAKHATSAYITIHSVVPSPSHDQIAYSIDTVGNEIYDVFVRDLFNDDDSDHDDQHIASGASGTIVWGITEETLYIVGIDQSLFRPYRLYQWTKSSSGKIMLLAEEPNNNVYCELGKSADGQYVFWIRICHNHKDSDNTAKTLSSPLMTISALDLSTDRFVSISCPRPILRIDHRNGLWWALLREDNGSIALSTATVDINTSAVKDDVKPEEEEEGWITSDDWTDFARECNISINDMWMFRNHIVLAGRQEGLSQIWILQLDDKDPSSCDTNSAARTRRAIKDVEKLEFNHGNEGDEFSTAGHYCSVECYQDCNADSVIVTCESMVSPPQTVRIDLKDPNNFKKRSALHETKIPGYSKEQYDSQRLYVLSRDGQTQIPVSVVYRKTNGKRKQSGRLHLLGYGAYGHSLEPSFSAMKIPLLNRGVACAIAHVRGGGEVGDQWCQDGCGLNKPNSINDFVDVAKWFVESDENWTKPELFTCEGRSAGGLLVAAAVNQRPELFRSVFLCVPFLDVLASMSDPSLPLTALEYGEWGNPHTPEGLQVIRNYCPIQNVRSRTKYPSFWIST